MMRAPAGLLAAVALVLIAGPAAADGERAGTGQSPSEEPGTGRAVYEVVVTDTSTGPAGEQTIRTDEGELQLACTEQGCRVVVEPGFGLLSALSLVADGSAARGHDGYEAAGSPCAGGRGARVVDVEARSTGFTATLVQQPVEWIDCPAGDQGYAHARTVTWTGTPVSFDPCVFGADGAACAAGNGTASRLASGDAAAPSVLSALTPPAMVRITPAQALWTAVLTVILLLLVAFPTALLNRAVDAASDRLSGWWSLRRAARAPGGADAAGATRGWSRSWWWAALGVLAASVISSFVDPQFGFTAGSARVVLSILVSFAIDVMLGWMLLVWIMGRALPEARHSYDFQPLSLLVVVAAVVFTRVTGFEPGIVFGLVAGVSFTAVMGAAGRARSALITVGYAYAAALTAWVLYGFVADGIGDSFGATLLGETLAALAVGGIASLPIALLPVRGLSGRAIWDATRTGWAVCYAVGLLSFFVVLMPMPFSWGEVGWELWAWIGVYAGYAVVAVLSWALLTRPWQAPGTDAGTGSGEAVPASAPPHADKVEG